MINLVRNTDQSFDYDGLVQANENDPALKNIIKNFNKDYIELNPIGPESEETTTNTESGNSTTGPVDTVEKMAKRAAKSRGAAI